MAAGLDGRPAWVIGGAAVQAALAGRRRAGRRRPVTVGVGAIGPPAVLALAARAGAWASVASGHELSLARQAGFPARRIVVQAPALDDGFILEALSARVAVLVRRGPRDAARVARIARGLELPLPRPGGAPPRLPASALSRCGGLLARLIDGPPRLVLDALWEPVRAQPLVVPVAAPSPSAGRLATLAGLTTTRAVAARLLGRPARGDWVLVVDPAALVARPSHPAWPLPRSVLVQRGGWRLLDARPLPPAD